MTLEPRANFDMENPQNKEQYEDIFDNTEQRMVHAGTHLEKKKLRDARNTRTYLSLLSTANTDPSKNGTKHILVKAQKQYKDTFEVLVQVAAYY